MRPSFRLHEICCRLTDALLAHADLRDPARPDGYAKLLPHNVEPALRYTRQESEPVSWNPFRSGMPFGIVIICPSHNASEIDGSRNLSARGLDLERIFARSCIYSARSCRHLSSYPAVSNWLITNQISGTGNCGSFYFSYFFQIVLYALYNLINVPFDCISFLFYVRCFLFDLLCQVKSDTNILPKRKKFF